MNTLLPCLSILLFLAAILVALVVGSMILRELRQTRPVVSSKSPVPVATFEQTTPAPAPKPGRRANAKLYRQSQMTRAESRFYDFLSETVKGQYLIGVKTQLKDLFKRYGWLEKELYTMHSRGHVDFVLLEPTLKTPIIAIELDGTTHNDPAQLDRDRRKEEIFRRGDMKLLRFQVGRLWGEAERKSILEALPKPLN